MGRTQFLLFLGTFEKCLEMGENDKKGQETGETTKVSRNGRNIISPVDKIHSMPAGQRTARA